MQFIALLPTSVD